MQWQIIVYCFVHLCSEGSRRKSLLWWEQLRGLRCMLCYFYFHSIRKYIPKSEYFVCTHLQRLQDSVKTPLFIKLSNALFSSVDSHQWFILWVDSPKMTRQEVQWYHACPEVRLELGSDQGHPTALGYRWTSQNSISHLKIYSLWQCMQHIATNSKCLALELAFDNQLQLPTLQTLFLKSNLVKISSP